MCCSICATIQYVGIICGYVVLVLHLQACRYGTLRYPIFEYVFVNIQYNIENKCDDLMDFLNLQKFCYFGLFLNHFKRFNLDVFFFIH